MNFSLAQEGATNAEQHRADALVETLDGCNRTVREMNAKLDPPRVSWWERIRGR